MIEFLIQFAFYLLAWLLLSVLLSWLSAFIYPMIASSLERFAPAKSALFTFVLAFMAPLSALFSTLILTHPELAFPIVSDHCHGDACNPHSLHVSVDSIIGSGSIAFALATITLLSLGMIWQLRENLRLKRLLNMLSSAERGGYRIVEDAKPLARCVGLLKPKVFVSTGLMAASAAQQQKVIIARQLAKAASFENLRYWLLKWATMAWPKPIKLAIRQDFLRHSASDCDLQAYRALGNNINQQGFLETLQQLYQQQGQAHEQTEYPQRLNRLEQNLSIETALDANSGLLSFALLATSLLYIYAAVFVGHPLVEALAR
ncbi:MAG: hypothetical protein OIF51_14075 [Cellvibrionaceae bacterium]|nr:hypothetical protein [Cellvibrionaceae bacterium]